MYINENIHFSNFLKLMVCCLRYLSYFRSTFDSKKKNRKKWLILPARIINYRQMSKVSFLIYTWADFPCQFDLKVMMSANVSGGR